MIGFGAAGLLVSFVGFVRLDDGRSVWDSVYSSVQLLALDTSGIPDDVPMPALLQIGRWLCAIASASVAIGLALHFGLRNKDYVIARLGRGYRLVIGDGDIAREFAAVSAAIKFRRGAPVTFGGVVLVGDVSDIDVSDLQDRGVRTAGALEPTAQRRLMQRAADVVVIETHDTTGLEVLARAQEAEVASEHVSIALRSSTLARVLRAQQLSEAQWDGPSVISLSEAVAATVVADYYALKRRPPVIVAGEGDMATDIATLLIDTGADRSEPPSVTLIASDDSWTAGVRHRTDPVTVRLEDRRCHADADSIAAAIIDVCRPDHDETGHLVVLAGLPAPIAMAAAAIAENRLALSQIVTVVNHNPLAVAFRASGDSDNWERRTLSAMLDDRAITGQRVLDRLARQLRAEEVVMAQSYVNDPSPLGERPDRSGPDIARIVIEELRTQGFVFCPRSGRVEPRVPTQLVPAVMSGLTQRLVDAEPPTLGQSAAVGELVTQLPQLFGRIGIELRSPAMDQQPEIDNEVIERIALAIHESYRETMRSLDDPTCSPVAHLAWEELSDRDRQANRAAAEAFPVRAALAGLVIVDTGTPGATRLKWTPEQVGQLAEIEHQRWMAGKIRGGWTLGPRDPEGLRLTHPGLRPYDELSADERELDRALIRAMTAQLDLAALAVLEA